MGGIHYISSTFYGMSQVSNPTKEHLLRTHYMFHAVVGAKTGDVSNTCCIHLRISH
jgi:hypothetical protein